MYYMTLKVLDEQIKSVYQNRLIHGWGNTTLIGAAVILFPHSFSRNKELMRRMPQIHRQAEGLRRKGKVAGAFYTSILRSVLIGS